MLRLFPPEVFGLLLRPEDIRPGTLLLLHF